MLASVILGVALAAMMWAMAPLFGLPGWRYLALLALVLGGMVAYFGAGAAIGAFRISDFTGAMRRGR